jgi:RNA polymerase sigma factor (sigma-70 family)
VFGVADCVAQLPLREIGKGHSRTALFLPLRLPAVDNCVDIATCGGLFAYFAAPTSTPRPPVVVLIEGLHLWNPTAETEESGSMSETLAAGRKGGSRGRQGAVVSDDAVSPWFVREILPLEPFLMRYLRRNWKNESEIADLRQEIYIRIFDAARERIPDDARRYLTVTARNFLIDLLKHKQIVSIETVADVEALEVPADAAGPDRVAAARDELRHVQAALDRLPPRAQEAVRLTYVEDLPVREIAARMGVTKSMVSKHVASGMRALADMLYGETPDRGGKS